MRSYYLDSNAWSYALGQPHLGGWTKLGCDHLRSVISEQIRAERISVLGSQYLLEEASRIPSGGAVDARARFFDFFWSTVQWLLVLPTDELVIEEAKAGGRLDCNEPFDDVRRRMLIKQQCHSKESLDRLAASVEKYVNKVGAEQAARKKTVIDRLKAKNARPTKATKGWWADAEAQVEDWVSDYIAKSAELLGLPKDRAQWPSAKSQQTAWAMHSHLMARVALTIGESWEVDDGDLHDAHHYASACYGDAFVVQDKGSRATIKLIPEPKVDALSFDEFAADEPDPIPWTVTLRCLSLRSSVSFPSSRR